MIDNYSLGYVPPNNRIITIPSRISYLNAVTGEMKALSEKRCKLLSFPAHSILKDNDYLNSNTRACGILIDELRHHVILDSTASINSPKKKDLFEIARVNQFIADEINVFDGTFEIFVSSITKLKFLITNIHESVRDVEVIVKLDKYNNVIIYPPANTCLMLLGELYDFIITHISECPDICATVAYLGIIHAHPFRDGNGRTARALYNYISTKNFGESAQMPINSMMSIDFPSFLLKMRRALYHGQLHEMQKFFTGAACMLSCCRTVDFMNTQNIP